MRLVERGLRSRPFTTLSARWASEATPENVNCTRLVVTDLEQNTQNLPQITGGASTTLLSLRHPVYERAMLWVW